MEYRRWSGPDDTRNVLGLVRGCNCVGGISLDDPKSFGLERRKEGLSGFGRP